VVISATRPRSCASTIACGRSRRSSFAKLAGTAFFLFFATAEQNGDPEGLLDWSVGIWSTALATALVVAAFRLRRGDRRSVQIVNGLLLVEIAFSLVKLFVYDEPESFGFMAVDLVIFGLLALISRRPRK
jgi:hypothetical protein